MRFTINKEEKEKLMNKMIKAVKQSAKNLNDEDYEGLSNACMDSIPLLYKFFFDARNIDTKDLEDK